MKSQKPSVTLEGLSKSGQYAIVWDDRHYNPENEGAWTLNGAIYCHVNLRQNAGEKIISWEQYCETDSTNRSK